MKVKELINLLKQEKDVEREVIIEIPDTKDMIYDTDWYIIPTDIDLTSYKEICIKTKES